MRKIWKNMGMFMLAAVMVIATGCSSNKGFENGVYYSEKDHNISITVSEITDLTDNKTYTKSCKVQFSDNYDFTNLNYIFSVYVYNLYTSKHPEEFENLSDEEETKKFNEMVADIEKNIDLKKQLSENACTFYLIDVEDNDFDIIETPVEGVHQYGNTYDIYFDIRVYDDGHLRIEAAQEKEIFTR